MDVELTSGRSSDGFGLVGRPGQQTAPTPTQRPLAETADLVGQQTQLPVAPGPDSAVNPPPPEATRAVQPSAPSEITTPNTSTPPDSPPESSPPTNPDPDGIPASEGASPPNRAGGTTPNTPTTPDTPNNPNNTPGQPAQPNAAQPVVAGARSTTATSRSGTATPSARASTTLGSSNSGAASLRGGTIRGLAVVGMLLAVVISEILGC